MTPEALENFNKASLRLMFLGNSMADMEKSLMDLGFDKLADRVRAWIDFTTEARELMDKTVSDDCAITARNAAKNSGAVLLAALAGVEMENRTEEG